mgnify:FL=1
MVFQGSLKVSSCTTELFVVRMALQSSSPAFIGHKVSDVTEHDNDRQIENIPYYMEMIP